MSDHRPKSFQHFHGQEMAVSNLSIAVEAAKRQGRALAHTLLAGPAGLGKCLAPDTPVLLYSGEIVPCSEVRVGDQLMGMDSQPRRVLSTSIGYGPLFRVKPTKGEPWVCNDVHVLTLVRYDTKAVVDVPLNEYLAWNKTQKSLHKLFSSSVVEFPPQPDPVVDPYFFGLWIGDGTKELGPKGLRTVAITKANDEIRQAVENVAATYALSVKQYARPDRCPTWTVTGPRTGEKTNPLLEDMREVLSGEIRIPATYRCGSVETRWQVLAGIIDTDGHAIDNTYEVVQKSKQIADDITFIARSLGLLVTYREKPVNGVIYHRLFISGNTDQIPVRLPRRKVLPRRQRKNHLHTGFTVEPLGEGDYTGFELDGDGRFLLGSFMVTHNTTLSLHVLPAEMGVGSRVINCAAIDKPNQLINALCTTSPGDILFLDEVHALPIAARDHLLTAMEEQRVTVSIDESQEEVMNIDIPAFTIIGATTRRGLLDGPLRSRFRHIITLTPYTDSEMQEILQFHAQENPELEESERVILEPEAKGLLASAAKGVARNGVNLLRNTIDTFLVVSRPTDWSPGDQMVLTEKCADATLLRLGYVGQLSPEEWRYLSYLALTGSGHKTVGLNALAQALDEQPVTIEEVYEPWLIRSGYVIRQPRGRELTKKGLDLYQELAA